MPTGSTTWASSTTWARGSPGTRPGLGVLYYEGLGVPRDDVQAYVWLHLAAAAGERTARTNRDRVARALSAAQIAEAQSQAEAWMDENRAD